jgi:hypothetical protein
MRIDRAQEALLCGISVDGRDLFLLFGVSAAM